MCNYDGKLPPQPLRLRLTETPATGKIEDNLINGVLVAAVTEEDHPPGIWQKMIRALYSGAAKTKGGSVNEFLFQAMVDRLLEEFHALESDPEK